MASGSGGFCDRKKVVLEAIQAVLEASTTLPTAEAPKDSTVLLAIIERSASLQFNRFCDKLCQALQGTLNSVGRVQHQLAHERAITAFHRLRMDTLPLIWKEFCCQLSIPGLAVYWQQAINYHLFKNLTVDTFKAVTSTTNISHASVTHTMRLSSEEENAIRYAGGYVTNKLIKHYLHTSTVPAVNRKAAKFVECLHSMGCSPGDEESFLSYTMEWTTKMDRGGLFYINDRAYLFYKEVEIFTQAHLIPHLHTVPQDDRKQLLIRSVVKEDRVQYHWSALTVDITADDGEELLDKVVETWITIRGVAVVSHWLEQYKLAVSTTKSQKNAKKGKSFRTNLKGGQN